VGVEITVDGVCFAYGRRRVLHGVDWVVRPGVTGLLGPRRSGKTTLLNVLSGRLQPTDGDVIVHHDAAPGSPRIAAEDMGSGGIDGDGVGAWFGFVPQCWSVAGGVRVVDTVAFAAWVNGVPATVCAMAARRAVGSVGLADQAEERVRSLSGEQRRRLGIAAALAHDPAVVVLDEPTAGLDPEQRLSVWDLVAEIGRTRTVVVSSLLIEEVAHVCGRVGVLAAGRLVFDGAVTDLARLDPADGAADGGDGAGGDGNGGVASEVGSGRRSAVERGYARLLETVGGGE
jgi:ABC-2 type transport system ATP-binding protein